MDAVLIEINFALEEIKIIIPVLFYLVVEVLSVMVNIKEMYILTFIAELFCFFLLII